MHDSLEESLKELQYMNRFFCVNIKTPARPAKSNCQDRGPAPAGGGQPAGRVGGAPEILELTKNDDFIVF